MICFPEKAEGSTGNIGLAQGAELMAVEHLFSHLVIFHAQAEDGFALRMRDEGIEIVDIQLGL